MRLLHRHHWSHPPSTGATVDEGSSRIVAAIIDAVSELLETKDLGSVTLSDIASRTGMSFEELSLKFSSIDDVFATVLSDACAKSRSLTHRVPTRSDEVAAYLSFEGYRLLAMPLSLATIASFAIDGGFGPTPSGAALQQIVIEEFERVWIEPLIDLGYPWIDIYAPLLAVLRKSFALVGAIDCGVRTIDDAQAALDEALFAAVPVAA